jgi:ParB family chromosome partitioning protein
MGKLDRLRQVGGANVAESTGGARENGLPPGMDPATAVGPPPRLAGLTREKDAVRIPVAKIDRDPSQPREEFDEDGLARLAESMKARGQLQPIRVRWDEERGLYVIVVGERRWRAARMAGLTELSCVIHGGSLGEADRLAVQLVENALREDLRPVEQARAYKALMEANDWSSRQLAAELHVGQSSVVRALALLDLPAPVQARVEQGALAPSVAYEVSKLADPDAQRAVAEEAVASGLNRAEVAEVVEAVKARRPPPVKPARTRPEPVEVDLGDGCTVIVRWKKPATLTAAQALRKALKVVLERDRDRPDRAA